MAAWCRGAGDGVTYEFHQVRGLGHPGASCRSFPCRVPTSPPLTCPLPLSEMHGPTCHLHRGVRPVVESLQRGLQGHVSSVPRKGRTLVGHPLVGAGGSPGVSGVMAGVGRRCFMPCRGISPCAPERNGTERPAGLRDLPSAFSLPAGWQGDRGPGCPCAHADTESRLSGSCSSSLRSSRLPPTVATSER